MSQQPPKSFSGRKHLVWCGRTLAINLFGWLTCFKSILTSLQALQCILCLPHIRHNFIRTTPPLSQTQILGATWLATIRVLSQGKRENTGNEVACSNNLCSVYSYKQELYKIQNFVNKKNRSLYWGLRYIEVRYVEVPLYIRSKFLVAGEQALCLGKKNSKESSPLDQRPVHRLNS